jgi:hypothetical protein
MGMRLVKSGKVRGGSSDLVPHNVRMLVVISAVSFLINMHNIGNEPAGDASWPTHRCWSPRVLIPLPEATGMESLKNFL